MDSDEVKNELDSLIRRGKQILYVTIVEYGERAGEMKGDEIPEQAKQEVGHVEDSYQVWYTNAYRIIRQFLPERLEEFSDCYVGQKNIKSLNMLNAGIAHFLQGKVTGIYGNSEKYFPVFLGKFRTQISILESIQPNIDNILFNITGSIYFSVFSTGIEAARQLRKTKNLRASGALAGVVIESHLARICRERSIKLRKGNPSISEYNDLIKSEGVIDTAFWRQIQRCADIRNLCVHSKGREPTEDEIDDLIRGTEKVLADIS